MDLLMSAEADPVPNIVTSNIVRSRRRHNRYIFPHLRDFQCAGFAHLLSICARDSSHGRLTSHVLLRRTH